MDSSIKQKESKENRLPHTRVKAIMKGCPEIELISNDAIVIMAKATVGFFILNKLMLLICFFFM